MASRPKIGDIIEFPVDDGYGYAQYSHWDENYGELLRVFTGVHSVRPTDFQALVDQEEQFFTFFPLRRAVRNGLVRIVGSMPVPAPAQAFPVLRSGGPLGAGITAPWWLWDGERKWRVDTLDLDQQALSIKEIVGLPVIVERIKTGWKPRDESDA